MIWLHLATALATIALFLFIVVVRPDRSDYGLLALALIVGFGATLHLLLTLGVVP